MSDERGQALIEAVALVPACLAAAICLVDAGCLVRDRLVVADLAQRAAGAQLKGAPLTSHELAALAPRHLRRGLQLDVSANGTRITVRSSTRRGITAGVVGPVPHRSHVVTASGGSA